MRRPRTDPIFRVHGVNDRNGPRLRVRTVMRDYTKAEYDARRAVHRPFRDIQNTFDKGHPDKACDMLWLLVLRDKSDRSSFGFRMIETSRVICRVTEHFGGPWDESEPGRFDLENLEIHTLIDDVLMPIVLDNLGYPYGDIFLPGKAPYYTDDGYYGGEFRPGYNEDDMRIRFERLQALVNEHAADHNLSREETKALLSRCYPALDKDDPRFSKFCGGQ